jgi:hypothetical protein
MKSIISDKTVSYNKKYGNQGQGENVAHFIFITNNMVPIKIEKDDARYFVQMVKSTRQNDIEFFQELVDSCTDEFFQNLMSFLLYRNLNGFEHRAIPMTIAKMLILKACSSPIEEFITENFQFMSDISEIQLWDLFKTFCKSVGFSLKNYTKYLLIAEMDKYIIESEDKEGIYNLRSEVFSQLDY